MSRAALFAAFAATLPAVPALAEAADDAGKRALLIATIEDHGCRLTEALADEVLPPLGFVMEETRPIFQALMGEGLAELDGDVLVLRTEACL